MFHANIANIHTNWIKKKFTVIITFANNLAVFLTKFHVVKLFHFSRFLL